MRVLDKISVSVALLAVCLGAGTQALADGGWQRVAVSSEPFIDRNGAIRSPGCSGAPVGGILPDPSALEFSFFYREGKFNDKLVIAFDGGGACWDALTCLGSVLGPDPDPVYEPTVDEDVDDLNAGDGLADSADSRNPVADYFQVFIPYCTGDLHIGSSDTEYVLPGFGPYTIRHRGYDNVIAVLEWLVDYYTHTVGKPPKDVFVAGASAGGYGAFFAYPAIHELLPWWSRKRVFSDSANGIINQDFYERALAPGGAWAIWTNMPPELAGAFSSGPDALPIALNQSLGWNYPWTRFGQYTRAFDAVQIFYLNVAKNLNTPELWSDPTQLILAALEWTAKARANMLLSAATTFNYRFYLGAGFGHTTIADDSVYSEDTAQGVMLINWLDDMINRRYSFGGEWRNVSCSPDCIP